MGFIVQIFSSYICHDVVRFILFYINRHNHWGRRDCLCCARYLCASGIGRNIAREHGDEPRLGESPSRSTTGHTHISLALFAQPAFCGMPRELLQRRRAAATALASRPAAVSIAVCCRPPHQLQTLRKPARQPSKAHLLANLDSSSNE